MSVSFHYCGPYAVLKGATRDHLDECLVFNTFSGDLRKTFSQYGIRRMKLLGGISPSTSASRPFCSLCYMLLTDLTENQGPIYSETAISDRSKGKYRKSVTARRNRSISPLYWIRREGRNIFARTRVGACTRKKSICSPETYPF